MKKVYFIFILFNLYVSAQDIDPVNSIDFMGTVFDKTTNIPLQINLKFKDAAGKEYVAESHPKTGWFQLLLPPQDYYFVTLSSPVILQKIERINLKSIKQGDRQIFDFYVTRIVPGLIVDSLQIFANNSTGLRKNADFLLDSYIENLKINTGSKFVFLCDTGDTNTIDSFGNGRISTIRNYLEKWRSDSIFSQISI
jgi:hypothetical protein